MRKKILLLTVAVLFSTVNGFADSDRYVWGFWALERGDFSTAVQHFTTGANAGYSDCEIALANCYLVGMGVAKNPAKAYALYKKSISQDSKDISDHRFWIMFHRGDPFRECLKTLDICDAKYVGAKFANNIPKFSVAMRDDFTCKNFGVSPSVSNVAKQIKNAGKHNFKSNLFVLSDELVRPVYQHAKKTNDKEVIEAIKKYASKFYYEKDLFVNDSIKYSKINKDARSLDLFMREKVTTLRFYNIAIQDYFKIAVQEYMKDGDEDIAQSLSLYEMHLKTIRTYKLHNKLDELKDLMVTWAEPDYFMAYFLDKPLFDNSKSLCSLTRRDLEDLYYLVDYMDIERAKRQGYYECFYQMIEKDEWENATKLARKFPQYSKKNVNTLIELNNIKGNSANITIEECKSHIKNVNGFTSEDIDTIETNGFKSCRTYLAGLKSELAQALNSKILVESEAWNVNTSTNEMCDLTTMMSNAENKAKVQDKFDQVAVEKATAWNFGTEIDEMNLLLSFVSSDASKAKVSQEYNRVALEKAATWTVAHSATLMDAVVEMNYLDEETKAKVQEAYQKNALDRMKAAGKSKKDLEKVKTTLESVKSMKHVNAVTKMRADEIYEKAEAKTRPFFLIGVEGGVGLTGGMKTLAPAGGASIILGRSSHRLNLYVGGQYVAENGILISYYTEGGHFASTSTLVAAKFKKIEVPAELRFNYLVDNYYCSYIGVGAVYNYVLGGDVYYLEEGSDKVSLLTFTDGLNPNYLAARVSWGLRLMGVDLGLYVNYNLTSPYNSNAVTDDLSVFEGTYFDTQMKKSKITTGLRLGIYF